MIFHEIPGNNPYFSIKFPGFGIKLICREDGRRKLFHKNFYENPYNSMKFLGFGAKLISHDC
jgi:hypothetical protein